jgi:DNA-binding FadR family transcriptional regulator
MFGLSPEVDRAAELILRRIVSGAYPAGLRLPPENDLAAEIGVGRSTIREALRHLASLGLVRSRRGSGVLVQDFRREGTLALLPAYLAAGRFDRPLAAIAGELLRMRTLLAAEAARLAAIWGTPEGLAPARRIYERLAKGSADPLALALAEMEMFRELVHASAVWPAAWLGNAFWGPVRELHERFALEAGFVPPEWGATFGEVFRRIEARDADGASALVREHFERVDRDLLALLDRAIAGSERRERSAKEAKS